MSEAVVQPAPKRSAHMPPEPIPFKLAQGFCRILTSTVFDLKVWGVEHVPRTGGVLLVSNHQSFLDPVLLGCRLPRSLSYMARHGLFEVNPAFTWLIRSLGAFPVRQEGSAAGAIKEAVERLQSGHALNIYPEGSRTDTGEILKMEKGVALVIRKAKVPVVPAAIDGSWDAWKQGQKLPRPYPIRLMYGPAVELGDKRPEEIVSTIDREIRSLHSRLKARRTLEMQGLNPPVV